MPNTIEEVAFEAFDDVALFYAYMAGNEMALYRKWLRDYNNEPSPLKLQFANEHLREYRKYRKCAEEFIAEKAA